MSKQVLDVQQMQHLQELGLELKETILVWARFMLGKTQISDWEIAYNHSAITDNSQTIPAYTLQDVHDTPQEAFAHLINKVSRKDVWKENPYVFVYDFELVK